MNSSFDNIIKSEKPVLIDFFATWCGPCKVLGPILKRGERQSRRWNFHYKIDVDKTKIASKYQVRVFPNDSFQGGKQL
jgi:thioredoxin 1